MLMRIEKDIFRGLFSDKASIDKITAIGEVWDNRDLILGAFINDALNKTLGFAPDSDRYTYKKVTDKIKLAFIRSGV